MAACFSACSPSSEKSVADYANAQQASELLDACDAMESGRHSEAYALLKSLQTRDDSGFVSLAYHQELTRLAVESANDLMVQGKLNELNKAIEANKQSPNPEEILPEVLAFSRYYDALSALRYFIQYMPWTDSKILRDNLVRLDWHKGILEESPAYRAFRAKQNDTVRFLEREEKTSKLLDELMILDRNQVEGRPAVPSTELRNLIDEMAKQKTLAARKNVIAQKGMSDEPLFQMLAEYEAFKQAFCKETSSWKSQQGDLAKYLEKKSPKTLSGKWFAICYRIDGEWERIFDQEQATGMFKIMPRPSVISYFLTKRILNQEHFAAWCWRSPCPGGPELIARLKQMGQRANQQRKH